jgi:hypothetical protein
MHLAVRRRELYGGRRELLASQSREADDSVLVKTERERKAKPKK